jgi:hypothetical protein
VSRLIRLTNSGTPPPTTSRSGTARGRSSYRPRASAVAREKAIERARGRYFTLACGHMTCLDDQEVYAAWKPGRGKYWCEADSRWVKAAPKPKRKPLPQEPLF